MPTLGLAVITKNEEEVIEKCIKSFANLNQIVVVDCGSKDNTCKIAKDCGAKVIYKEWEGYAKQKQYALNNINTDWVLIFDADEFSSKSLNTEILELINTENPFNAYIIKGHNIFMGKELKFGKGVDKSIRLVKKNKSQWNTRIVHEDIETEGKVGVLHNNLIHYSNTTIKKKINKMNHYLDLDSNYISSNCTMSNLFITPIRYFFGQLIRNKSWKDGIIGIIWLLLHSFEIFIMSAMEYERSIQPDNKKFLN